MQSHFERGEYLEAAKAAVDGLRDPNLKPQILAFMENKGPLVIEKALYQGEILMKRKARRDAIYYHQALIPVLEEMILLDVPLLSLKEAATRAEKNLGIAISQYMTYHYTSGEKAYSQKKYRESIRYFNNVLDYDAYDKETMTYIKEATQKARRILSISPFFKPADPMTQILTETISGLYTNAPPPEGIFETTLIIDGLDLPAKFNAFLLESFNHKKTTFLTVSLDYEDHPIKHTNYYLEGTIDAKVQDNGPSPYNVKTHTSLLRYMRKEKGKEVWQDTYFTYNVYTIEQSVTILIDAQLHLTINNEQISALNFEKTASTETEFRGSAQGLPSNAERILYPPAFLDFPDRPFRINKSLLVNQALKKAAEHLGEKILETIDRDLDPAMLDEL